MKNITRDITLAAAKVSPAKARIALFVLTLAMFVIAGGAPDAGPDFVR